MKTCVHRCCRNPAADGGTGGPAPAAVVGASPRWKGGGPAEGRKLGHGRKLEDELDEEHVLAQVLSKAHITS